MCVVFWLEKLKERECSEKNVTIERKILKWILKVYDQVRGMFVGAEQEQEYSLLENFLNFLVPSNVRKFLTS